MCNWNNEIIRFVMTVDSMVGPLDAIVIFLLLLLAGTCVQRIVNLRTSEGNL
ncbi:hypothetical protein LOC68_05500 [Blastopirellula sp. JC732]|uniref:Uncharacterized protein n=1 Tax=Blastopirellula sediminis TaxID=2894196 RepID=A0A9X1MIR5_9BACT|nr:hypothetical protein [Blastopirellula sediminis]MCC9609380.1 hypothetical protein [Blastopirellula sediminis]MCC9627843.1 hypothetical protein [Blastopirellula sediminis]